MGVGGSGLNCYQVWCHVKYIRSHKMAIKTSSLAQMNGACRDAAWKLWKVSVYVKNNVKLPSKQVLHLTPADLGVPIPNVGACCQSHVTLCTCKVTLIGGKDAGHRYIHRTTVQLTTNRCGDHNLTVACYIAWKTAILHHMISTSWNTRDHDGVLL